MNEDVLLKVVRELERLDIPYMVVGSFSVSFWGAPRTTHDADLVAAMPAELAGALARALRAEFYADDESMRRAIYRHSMFNVIHFDTGFKVDVWLLSADPYRQVAFERRRRVRLFEGSQFEVYVATAEDTILSKLLWFQESGSDRDFDDVVAVYEIQAPDLDQVFLDGWAGNLGISDLLARVRAEAALPPDEV